MTKIRYIEIKDKKNIQKIEVPNGVYGNILWDGNKILLPVIYDPFTPDEEWYKIKIKIYRGMTEYEGGDSYQYLGSVIINKELVTVLRIL